MDRWMCGRAGRCMTECMGGCWLIYGVFPNQGLETSVAPSLGWGSVSTGSELLCVSRSSGQTWGELEQSTQAGRAQVCILTADRRPGSWTAPGGRSPCPLRSTLQGKRRRESGSGFTTPWHCPLGALDWDTSFLLRSQDQNGSLPCVLTGVARQREQEDFWVIPENSRKSLENSPPYTIEVTVSVLQRPTELRAAVLQVHAYSLWWLPILLPFWPRPGYVFCASPWVKVAGITELVVGMWHPQT